MKWSRPTFCPPPATRCGSVSGRKTGIPSGFTVKRGEGIKRQEEEREISQEEYQTLLTQADPTKRVLHKTRYCLPYRGKLLEVDLYPFWQDQAVLEVELEQEDDLISIPPELTVLREVTGDAAYKNAVLAKTDKEVPL